MTFKDILSETLEGKQEDTRSGLSMFSKAELEKINDRIKKDPSYSRADAIKEKKAKYKKEGKKWLWN